MPAGHGHQYAVITCGCLSHACVLLPAARAYQRQMITAPGAAVVAAASLATLGCSLRFGLVMLAYSYTSHKLRQFKDNSMVTDYGQVAPAAPQQLRKWPEVSIGVG